MTPIIRFESVNKRYSLRHGRPRSFREVFVNATVKPGRRADSTLWALSDVSFAIEPGETVALIGANGAGKSTALKLISRVIFPSSGQVIVGGRVGALLELGTGFHPDLSGRDNILLAGALAGMSRQEMLRKLPLVVDFSELEPFIDVPVKNYSSGMYARLAFALSIHIDPEVLLIDEVLAVGDHAFQHKCLDRVAELRQAGVTICLVSHSTDIVRTLCSRALWFDHGRLMADGRTEPVVLQYLQHATELEAQQMAHKAGEAAVALAGEQARQAAAGVAPPIRVTGVRLLNAAQQPQLIFETGDPLTLEIAYTATEPIDSPVFGVAIHRHDGVHITGPNTGFAGLALPTLCGDGTVTYRLDSLPLLDGLYHFTVAIVKQDDSFIYDYHDRRYPFRVANTSGRTLERYGMLTLNGQWEHLPARRP